MRLFTIACVVLWSLVASAQQLLPLTDWRAQIDLDLGKVPMSRDAHGQVIGILQSYEQRAQTEKRQHVPPLSQGQVTVPEK